MKKKKKQKKEKGKRAKSGEVLGNPSGSSGIGRLTCSTLRIVSARSTRSRPRSGNACSGVPHPHYFIGLSSATLSYFTYTTLFFYTNTKYPTTRPHRRTNPPHHAPAGNKAYPFTHRPNHSSPPPHHIQCCLTSVRDKLSCESSGTAAFRSSLEKIKRDIGKNLFIFNKKREFWNFL